MTTEQLLFPPFRLDISGGRLWRDDHVLALRPKTFAVLCYLLEHPGKLITNDELLKAVWSDVVVDESMPRLCIRELRQALGDDAKQPRFIETQPRRGYRFIGKVASSQYSVVSSPALPTQSSALSPQLAVLVGREAELAQLHEWWEKARTGERQVVFITGEPGIGKTTLVDAFLSGVRSREEFGVQNSEPRTQNPELPSTPGLWLGRGQCLEQYGEGEPYLPVLEALGQMCRGPDGRQVVLVLAQYAPTWLVQMPALVNAEEVDALQRKVAGATRERMLREMAEAFEALTAERALVLVLEDLHWSDHSTVELLVYLARRRAPARLLVIGTYRPTDVVVREHPLKGIKQELHVHGQCAELGLELLTEENVAEYVAGRFAEGMRACAPELARLVYRRTDGNALFMVNLVNELLTQRMIVQREGRWELKGMVADLEIGIPSSLRQFLERQLDRLSSPEREVLAAASVVGIGFSAAAVGAALDTETMHVEERCADLARREHFLRHGGMMEWPDGTVASCYRFTHAMYQEVLYERIPTGRRMELHRRIGEREEHAYGARAGEIAAELAVHFERGRDDWRAVQYLQQAAENAVRRYAHVEAIAALQNALLHVEGLPADERDRQRLELLLPLAFSLSILGRFREILDLLLAHREHLERLQEPTLAGPYYFRLGLTYSYLGNHEQAAQNAHHAIEEATRCNDESTMGKAHYVLALTSFWAGQPLQGVDHGWQAVALLERTEEQNWLGLAHWILGLNYLLLGEFAPALEAEERTRTIAEAIADPRLQSFAAWSSGWIYAVRGDWEAGIEACQRGLERSPDPVTTAGALSYTGYAYLEKGDPAQAILLLEQSVQQFGQFRMRQSQGRVIAWLSEAYLLNGDLEKARELAIQGLATSREVQSRWGIGWAQRVLGRIAQTSGTLAEAETHLIEALQTFASMPARFEVGRTHLALAELAHAQGNQKAVATHLNEAHHLFKALQAPKHLEQTEHLVKVLGLSLAVDALP
jgi:DNA-binding winged helix-turn-helix (wHTH) protein/tetratricopeptide (TPR) repeat protein